MNIDQIIQIVLQVLSSVAPHIAPGVGKEIGAGLARAPVQLYKLIRARFRKHGEAEETLDDFMKAPDDAKAQADFREQLAAILKQDRSFASELETLILSSNLTVTQSIGQIASTVFDVRPEYAETIQFIVNIQGEGPGTIGEALSRLPSFRSSFPLLSLDDQQNRRFLEQLQQIIAEHSTELEVDLALLSNILKSAVTTEQAEPYPRPRRLLLKVIDEIGQGLQASGVFDSRFAIRDNPVFLETTKTREYKRKLAIPEVAQAFDKDETKIFLVRVHRYHTKGRSDSKLIRRPPISLLERLISRKRGVFTYRVEYRGFSLFHMGDYHLDFAKIDRTMHHDRGYYSLVLPEEYVDSYALKADVIAKFLRAILYCYIRYMRYPESMKSFLGALQSTSQAT